MQSSTIAFPACLDEVLAYRHKGAIRRYLKENGGTQQEAEEVFSETLKWLSLCHRASEGGFACAIMPELQKIDEMWHTFLLFTLDYADFCQRYFGTFIHHLPNEAEDEDEAGGEGAEAARVWLTRQFDLVYDVLGEATLIAWYDDCLYALPA